MVTYIVRLYRKDNVAEDPAAGVVVNPLTGQQNKFTSAQELWCIINRDSAVVPVPDAEEK